MSPLPQELVDRWRDRRENSGGEGTVYWHILLGGIPHIRAVVKSAHDRLSNFPGLHMTPLRWLHITTLIAGPADSIGNEGLAQMLARAGSLLSDTPPINITLGRILYHPEAIVLDVYPQDALTPILQTAIVATRAVTGKDGVAAGCERSWIPHVTLCYSTARQPAAPIISALGKRLPTSEVSIETLSLVIQRGPERLWNWHQVGTIRLLGSDRSTLRCQPAPAQQRGAVGEPL